MKESIVEVWAPDGMGEEGGRVGVGSRWGGMLVWQECVDGRWS